MILIALLSPALALICVLLFFIRNWRKEVSVSIKRFAVPLGMVFGALGYSFRFFAETNDLSRYLLQVDNMSEQTFREVIANDSEMLYTRDSLFYFVNKCDDRYVLPFIVGFLIYVVAFYVLFDMIMRSKRRYHYSEVFFLSLIMVGVLAPLLIIGNVRCVLSYVLISFAVYRDTVQQKHNLLTLLLYILPIGLHSSAVVIIVVRLISILFQKIDKMKWVFLSLVLLLPLLIDFFHEHVLGILSGPIGDIFSKAIDMAYWYLHWTSGGWATQVESSISSNLVKIFGTIFLMMIIYLVLRKKSIGGREKNINEIESLYNRPMVGFLFLISVFALGCLHIKTGAFWRFESIIVLFSPVIFIQAFDMGVLSKKFFNALSSYAVLLVVYNILYQIINTNTTETLLNFVITPGVKIIYELIRGICLLR